MNDRSWNDAAPTRRVVKLGGRVQQDPALPAALTALCAELPGGLCIVHGGGDEISTLQRTLGGEPRFIGGRRVTSRQDVEVVRMALSGTSNKRLVSALLSAGAPAVGVSGEDAGLLVAEPVDAETFGWVGRVVQVQPRLLDVLLGAGFLPVVSPLARDVRGEGSALNVNGDDAAAALAAALGADEILFLADVPGVLVDGTVAPEIDGAQARALIVDGIAVGGMAAKLEAAQAALAAGVPRARIGGIDALLDPTKGTLLSALDAWPGGTRNPPKHEEVAGLGA